MVYGFSGQSATFSIIIPMNPSYPRGICTLKEDKSIRYANLNVKSWLKPLECWKYEIFLPQAEGKSVSKTIKLDFLEFEQYPRSLAFPMLFDSY